MNDDHVSNARPAPSGMPWIHRMIRGETSPISLNSSATYTRFRCADCGELAKVITEQGDGTTDDEMQSMADAMGAVMPCKRAP